ncbi:MAG: DNA alkylation repair protein [Campylobacterales bacterium]|nr:DNA alkylation repair protein [Campylobacterales bacterium]
MNQSIVDELNAYADTSRIPDSKRFFKTGIGEYGEGDVFLGIKVPDTRKVVKKHFLNMTFEEIEVFLYSKYHEHRLFALLVLVEQYKSKKINNTSKKEAIYHFYLKHHAQVNNWDLVDVSCHHIVGAHLFDKDRSLLYELAKSENLWEKRIAIISTFAFINIGEFDDTLHIADILLKDKHDLIHKAVGWALRNVGIKDLQTELDYLLSRYKKMPRTMLRYAIEKFDGELGEKYLKGMV